MPDDLGECVLDLLFCYVRGAGEREAAQEEDRAKLVSTWSGFVIPDQKPVQMVKRARVLERHGIEPSIVRRPIWKSLARPYSAMLGIVESDLHSSPSGNQESGNWPAS